MPIVSCNVFQHQLEDSHLTERIQAAYHGVRSYTAVRAMTFLGCYPASVISIVHQQEFLEMGYRVLLPYGDSSRYDLVIEDAEGQFWRVQVKTAWVEKEGYIVFATTSLRSRSTNGRIVYSRAGYQGQVDYFVVYSQDLRKVYLLPVNEVSQTRMHLRLVPSKNKQEKNVHWAADYEI